MYLSKTEYIKVIIKYDKTMTHQGNNYFSYCLVFKFFCCQPFPLLQNIKEEYILFNQQLKLNLIQKILYCQEHKFHWTEHARFYVFKISVEKKSTLTKNIKKNYTILNVIK